MENSHFIHRVHNAGNYVLDPGYIAEEQDTIEQGPLGELKAALKELLISKGADIKGKTQLKMIVNQEWSTTVGWISLIDSTNKKFGIVYWDFDHSGDSSYQTTLISAYCEDQSRVDLQRMCATINGFSDENYWDNTVYSQENAINKLKDTYGYDEVYIIDLLNGESKLELPNGENCEIGIEFLPHR